MKDETRKNLIDIIQAAAAGEPEEAYKLLRSAIQARHLAPVDIRRDPNLAILLEEGRLRESGI